MAKSTVPMSDVRGRMSRHPIDFRGPIGQWSAPVAGTVTAVTPAEFFGEGNLVELADLSVVQVRLAPTRYEPAPRMPDLVDVIYLVSGALHLSSPGGHRVVVPGGLVFSRPTRGDVLVVPEESVLLRATFPASTLRDYLLPVQDLPLVAVRPEHAAAFAAVLNGIIESSRMYRPSTSSALRDAVIEMAEAVLADSTGQRARGRSAALLVRARHHIDAVFTDPRTTPGAVAASLGVSVRALHLAFAREDLTVARFIQHRRLTEVQRALASGDPESVTGLARRYGFSSPQRLARGYQVAYGHRIGEQGPSGQRVDSTGLTSGTDGCSAGIPPE